MSLNACEIYLLKLRKDEIWRLLYLQRRSKPEVYKKLVQKGLGWLGEQRFRDVITEWEHDEPDVWPARPDCWRSPRIPELQGEALGSLSRSPGERQSQYWMTSSSSSLSAGHGASMRMSQSAGRPVSQSESPLVIEEASAINPKPSSGPPPSGHKNPDSYPKQGLAERPGSADDRGENRTRNWLLNTPSLGVSSSSSSPYSVVAEHEHDSPPSATATKTTAAVASSLYSSRPSYDDSSTSTLCVDCGEDHPCQAAFLYDPSCGYTYAHPTYDDEAALAMVLGPLADRGGCIGVSGSAAQPLGKGVSHVFGYIVHPAGGEGGTESEDDDEDEDGDEVEVEHPDERENPRY